MPVHQESAAYSETVPRLFCPSAHILDLLRLERVHLEQLIRQYAGGKIELTSDYYAAWNGNLRSVPPPRFDLAFPATVEIENRPIAVNG